MDEHFLKIQEQFREHFEHVDATTQIILKGHLLIEESLNSILEQFVFHPEFMESANLRFAQKIDVARSMSLGDHENPMWELAIAINSLRNELAHSLKSEKRDQKTKRVREVYSKLVDHTELRDRREGDPDEVILMWAVSYFLGFLTGFRREVGRFKELVDAMDRAINPHRFDDAEKR